ncbi:transport and Golgi organization protein 1 homolog isoform X2 [Pelobates fuscus]|uniref:transport and Golgi organization protein 1 homolog isoform X2 n=1 Tax=Pelobates fuscus TaxID=191477 RepID=UPI002FE42EB5
MAAARPHIYLLLLLAAHMAPGSLTLDRRFSELKRCADPECSMLMVRGKALKDFTGPDCRFVNFKKDESVYVYYKLNGRSTDLWAGSVGSQFGYFPKDLINIQQVYTDKDIEMPTDDTDFVCFDGGTDNFDNYNVDELLNKPKESTLGEEEDLENTAQLGHQPTLAKQLEEKERAIVKPKEEARENQENKREVEERTDESDSLAKENNIVPLSDKPEESTLPPTDNAEKSTLPPSGTDETVEDISVKIDTPVVNSQSENSQEENVALQISEDVIFEKPQVPDGEHANNGSITQGESTAPTEQNEQLDAYTLVDKARLQELKTNIGSLDDAIVSDDEETRHVTQEDKYTDEDFEDQSDSQEERKLTEDLDQPPSLPNEETGAKPGVLFENESIPPPQSEGKQVTPNEEVNARVDMGHATTLETEKNILTSWGDTFFAIVSGGEHTKEVTDLDGTDSEEEAEEDDNLEEDPSLTDDDNIYLIDMDKDGVKEYINGEPLTDFKDSVVPDLKDVQETISEFNNGESMQINTKSDVTTNAPADQEINVPTNDSTLPTIKIGSDPEIHAEKQESSMQPIGISEETGIKDETSVNNIAEKNSKSSIGENQESKTHQSGSDLETDIETKEHDVEEETLSGTKLTDDDQVSLKAQNISAVEIPAILQDSQLQSVDTDTREGVDAGEINMKHNFADTAILDDDKSVTTLTTEEVTAGSDKLDLSELLVEKEDKDTEPVKKDIEPFDKVVLESVNVPSDQLVIVSEVSELKELPVENENNKIEPLEVVVSEKGKPMIVTPAGETPRDVNMAKSENAGGSMDKIFGQNDADSTTKSMEIEKSSTTQTEQNKIENSDQNVKPKDVEYSPNLDNLDNVGQQIIVPESSEKLTEHGNKDKESSNLESGPIDVDDEDTEGLDAEQELLEDENAKNATLSQKLMENSGHDVLGTDNIRRTEESTISAQEPKPVEEEMDKETKLENEGVSFQKSPTENANKNTEELMHKTVSPTQENIKNIRVPEESSQDKLSEHHIDNPEQSETDDEKIPDDSLTTGNYIQEETSYYESIKELSIIREYLDEDHVEQFRKYLNSENVFRVEAMFHDMEDELKRARQDNMRQDYIDKALDQILEASENNILDFVEQVLDQREVDAEEMVAVEKDMFDEEAMLLEDIQEIAYRLRQKYSTLSESSVLAHGVVDDPEPSVNIAEKDKHLKDNPDIKLVDSESNDTHSVVDEPDRGTKEEEADMINLSQVDRGESETIKVNAQHVDTRGEETGTVNEEQVDTGKKETSTVNVPQVGTEEEGTGTMNVQQVDTEEEETGTVYVPQLDTEEEETGTVNVPRVDTEEEETGTVTVPRVEKDEEENENVNVPRVDTEKEEDTKVNVPHVDRDKEDIGIGVVPQDDIHKGHSDLEEPHLKDVIGEETGTVKVPGLRDISEPPFTVKGVETEHISPTKSFTQNMDLSVSGTTDVNEEGHVADPKIEEETGTENVDSQTTMSVSMIVSSMGNAFLTTKQSLGPVAGMLISALPEDLRPGADFHGVQWEVVISTLSVGIITVFVFFWRTCLSVKSRIYQVNEKQLAEKIANLMKEKSEALEKISEYEKKVKETKESETSTQQKSTDLLKEARSLKATIKELNANNKTLDSKMRDLMSELDGQKEENKKKQEMLYEGHKTVKRLEEQFEQHAAELSEFEIALNESKMREQKVRSDLRGVQEENARLKERKEQLLKEAEGWSERQRELDEQIHLQQKSHKDMEEALAYKENEIEVLTNCIMQLKQFEEDSTGDEGNWQESGDGELANGEVPDTRKEKMKTQIKQMMDVSRVKTTLSIIEEEKDLYQRKLSDEISARHELEEQIKQLQHDGSALHSEKTHLDNECKTLRQKVEILTELYQQKEMALQKKLTQEEYDRQEKEQKLSVADEKAILASEEVKIYKQRIQEMEEELQKTERSFKNQIASHEKKAHENWLVARTAERTLAEEKRECANLRQKLIEVNQRIAALQRPSIVKPKPGRPDHQPPVRRGALSRDGSFGPSPVSGGAPSPPMMIEGPGRSASANLSRTESLKADTSEVDAPPTSRRPPHDMSGRTSAPVELGHSANVLNSGPRTSSPSMTVDGMLMPGSKGPPSFPGTPVMNSPISQPPGRLIGQPPPRMHFGARSLPPQQMHGPPPAMREFPPMPLVPPDPRCFVRGPLGPREYLPGPSPFHGPRDFPMPPPGVRDFPPGPLPPGARDFPPGPPPPGARDFPPGPPPPGARDFHPVPLPPGARDIPPGAPPTVPRDFLTRPPTPGARDFPPGVREFLPGPRENRPGLPPPGARDFPPGLPPSGAREYLPGPPHPGGREFRAGPPPSVSRENLSGHFPPPGARDFMQGPPPGGVRHFPPGYHPGSLQGPSGPEQRFVPPGSQQPTQTDNEPIDNQKV